MDKAALIEKILAHLTKELEGYARSAKSAQAEATDEQSKAENKYDTRGLEASYLARGQSQQAAEVIEAVAQYQKLDPKIFIFGAPIDIGALVELSSKTEKAVYFIGPRAGGIEIELDGESIIVITPQSPLGQQLIGKKEGASLDLKIGPIREKYKIAVVS